MADDSRKCPRCGAVVRSDEHFCTECGLKMDGTTSDSRKPKETQEPVVPPEETEKSRTSVLSRYIFAGVLLILLGLGGFIGWKLYAGEVRKSFTAEVTEDVIPENTAALSLKASDELIQFALYEKGYDSSVEYIRDLLQFYSSWISENPGAPVSYSVSSVEPVDGSALSMYSQEAEQVYEYSAPEYGSAYYLAKVELCDSQGVLDDLRMYVIFRQSGTECTLSGIGFSYSF